MGKKEKEAKPSQEQPEMSYEQKKKFCSVIANPLADEKLCKKVLKLAKKAAKRKQLKRGVKEVVKALRKSVKGCVLDACVPHSCLTFASHLCCASACMLPSSRGRPPGSGSVATKLPS